MKQIIYLVRHAEPNYDNHDDINRELTPKGLQDCQRLIDYFRAISIDQIYSSPYKVLYRQSNHWQPQGSYLLILGKIFANVKLTVSGLMILKHFLSINGKTLHSNSLMVKVYKRFRSVNLKKLKLF